MIELCVSAHDTNLSPNPLGNISHFLPITPCKLKTGGQYLYCCFLQIIYVHYIVDNTKFFTNYSDHEPRGHVMIV